MIVRAKSSLPLKWHGGKQYLAKQIVSLFPEHTHYVETHFGGGAVLFEKPVDQVCDHSEVVNDLNAELTNFWKTLQTPAKVSKLKRILEATPFSESIWKESVESSPRSDVQRAAAFFIRFRQSRQGLGRDFATMSRNRTRRGMNEQVSSWLSAIEGLTDAHARLSRVVIFSMDAVDLIRQEDGPKTLFYLDPPYLHETRSAKNCYDFEMTEDQHSKLLQTLQAVKGKFILSGYRSKLYDSSAKKNEWNRVDIQIDNKASSAGTKEIKTECLWMNF